MGQDQQAAASSPAPFPASAEVERRAEEEGPDRRQSVVDRRTGIDRRVQSREASGYTGPERRVAGERPVGGRLGLLGFLCHDSTHHERQSVQRTRSPAAGRPVAGAREAAHWIHSEAVLPK